MLLLAILFSKLLLINALIEGGDSIEDVMFKQYNTYSVIMAYLTSLAEVYSDKVNVSTIGLSYEGRPILAAKISLELNREQGKRPIILIDAAMHAREWMAPSVALYLIYQLVQKKANEYLLYGVDWIIIPVLNPDGYEFSHTHEKSWRKTISNTDNVDCSGVDINRNFAFHWMEYGANKNECSQSYAGPIPFSETETQALRDIAFANKFNIKLYINLHAYASMILYPWSYTKEPIYNVQEHQFLGIAVAKAIARVRGTNYEVGQTSSLLYIVSGSSCDWMAGVVGVPLNFAIELPKGQGKFQPEPSEIIPTGMETFEGFKEFYKYVKTKWSPNYYY